MENDIKQEKFRFPKTRKSKDNPYTIGYDEQKKSYFLTFSDGSGMIQQIYIGQGMYEVFERFELYDLCQMNERNRHIDASELTEEYLHKNVSYQPNVVEEAIDRKMVIETIRTAIKILSPIQRRRLILYYFNDFTYEQIAQLEGCKYQSIQDAIKTAEEKIKIYLSK